MKIKILLVYANTPMEPLLPLGIASIATALNNAGYDVRLFDTTLYASRHGNSQAERASSGQVKPVDYESVGVFEKTTDIFVDFESMVAEHKPQLIGVSCVEATYQLSCQLLERISEQHIPVILGGAFATFSARLVLENPLFDFACSGEGETAIVALAESLSAGHDGTGIVNIWTRKGSTIIPPPTGGKLLNMDDLAIPRFDVFAPERIYRPMSGRLYRMMALEFSRGCPYKCTYCSAPALGKQFSDQGRWLRHKSIDRIMQEIEYYARNYNVGYFYFISETFLAMPKPKREEFYERYSEFKIPFWFNTRPETVQEDDIRKLEEIGCHRISMGLETGNATFRKAVLGRNYSNEVAIRAAQIIINSKIEFSVNNMIGFPDETREMVFETIELNRCFTANSHSVSVFQPFRGTQLHEYAVRMGYYPQTALCGSSFSESVLDMPSLSRDDIKGLYRTFNLYRTLDKALWPKIRTAENFDDEGNMAFEQLSTMVGSSLDPFDDE